MNERIYRQLPASEYWYAVTVLANSWASKSSNAAEVHGKMIAKVADVYAPISKI